MSFIDWFMVSFLYCFPNSYRSFMLLKALEKSNNNLFAFASKSKKKRQHRFFDRAVTFERKPLKKKHRNDTKKN